MNTEIILITDESGSISMIKTAVEEGFNSFIEEQKKLPGEAVVSHCLFHTEPRMEYQGYRLDQVPKLTLRPNGGTALFDAICTTLERQGKRIAEEKWADQVIVVISTDGEENSSKTHGLADVRRMIGHAEQHGWQFIFMAANQDAFLSAQNLGMTRAVTQTYAATPQGARGSYAGLTASVAQFRSAA